MKQDVSDQLWHAKSAEEVSKLLDSKAEEGLSDEQIKQREADYGLNALTEKKGTSPLVRFLLQFHQPLVYILLAAVIVTFLLKEWVDSGVILGVVLVNAIVGYIQENKALNAISALSKSMKNRATVLRNGKRQSIDAKYLVPGDIVLLQSGDKVPADMRLIKTRDLQIDESALTGESLPVEKSTPAIEEDVTLGDRRNMAYSTALVTYGTGVGVVTSTGDHTEIGKISVLISETPTLDTPLTRRIKEFSQILLYAIMALAALTFAIGFLHGQPLLNSFMAAVALAVGAIPEGLPAAVTIMLAIGVSRMAKRRAIIRSLPAVESLGSTTIICSDKTGTLTKNEMTVCKIFSGSTFIELSGNGYNPEGILYLGKNESKALETDDFPAVKETLVCGLLCNDSSLHEPSRDGSDKETQWTITGDPTEAAMLVAAHKAGMPQSHAESFERIDAIPFQSEYQYMAALVSEKESGKRTIYAKGSLEAILPKCKTMLDASGKAVNINSDLIQKQAEAMAEKGMRVLTFARKHIASNIDALVHDHLDDELEFVGLQAMIDPPRPEAIKAVTTCHNAGIDVKMITGDHALTALAIAQQLGIANQDDKAVTGKELSELTEDEFAETAKSCNVFARVTPDNKLQLVKALQAQKQIVAMTGDGVNDAPALRRADIGVAMALNGTEVAREASDIMLTDDNFATIEAAVEEGRGVFENLKKFIVWTLPTNGGEAFMILIAVLFGASLPLLPVHILWINMTTAVCLGLMLAFEPKEKGIMKRCPHQPDAPILNGELLRRIVLVSSLLCAASFGLFELELYWGASIESARTVAVAMLVAGEAFYLLNCRTLNKSVFQIGLFSNKFIWIGMSIMAVLQLILTYLPIMNSWFQTTPISLASWIRVLGCGAMISFIVGLEKHWMQKRSKEQP